MQTPIDEVSSPVPIPDPAAVPENRPGAHRLDTAGPVVPCSVEQQITPAVSAGHDQPLADAPKAYPTWPEVEVELLSPFEAAPPADKGMKTNHQHVGSVAKKPASALTQAMHGLLSCCISRPAASS